MAKIQVMAKSQVKNQNQGNFSQLTFSFTFISAQIEGVCYNIAGNLKFLIYKKISALFQS